MALCLNILKSERILPLCISYSKLICKGVLLVKVVLVICLSFFAAFGIVQMITRMICSSRRRKCDNALSYRVLVVQDCQDSVEGMVRAIGWEDDMDDLIVVDLGSTDETPKILEKLERELDFLWVMTPEEYRDYYISALSGCVE